MNESKILDVKINNITKSEVLQKISQLLDSNESGHQLCTTNPEFVLEAQKDPEFKNIINNSWLSTADGRGIQLAAKYLDLIKNRINPVLNFLTGMKIVWWGITGQNKKFDIILQTITGVDLMLDITKICAKKNKKIFLLGGFDDVPRLTTQNLKNAVETRDLASLQIDFCTFENTEKLAKIKSFQPDVLFVAIGHPPAQIWINQNLPNLPSVKLAIGVGGSFDYISGKIKRAPISWRSNGFEWLYRLIHQPKRLKRIWNAWIVFSWTMFKHRINSKKYQKRTN